MCVRNEEEFLMLNRVHPPEIHLAILAEAMRSMDVDQVYLEAPRSTGLGRRVGAARCS